MDLNLRHVHLFTPLGGEAAPGKNDAGLKGSEEVHSEEKIVMEITRCETNASSIVSRIQLD